MLCSKLFIVLFLITLPRKGLVLKSEEASMKELNTSKINEDESGESPIVNDILELKNKVKELAFSVVQIQQLNKDLDQNLKLAVERKAQLQRFNEYARNGNEYTNKMDRAIEDRIEFTKEVNENDENSHENIEGQRLENELTRVVKLYEASRLKLKELETYCNSNEDSSFENHVKNPLENQLIKIMPVRGRGRVVGANFVLKLKNPS